MRTYPARCFPSPTLLFLTFLLAGCQAPQYQPPARLTAHRFDALPPPTIDHPRELAMFAGATGAAMQWSDVMDAVEWAEVIIIGEQHDDAVGHAVEAAIVSDTLDRWPNGALSMEMLERDEQLFVDDYLDDLLSKDAFIQRTGSASWFGEGSWDQWYQPMIDAAKRNGSRVIAANAPRRYVRLAQAGGRLEQMNADRRTMFELPSSADHAAYRQRFIDIMTELSEMENDSGAHQMSEADVDDMFASQLVWDATMADSIADAQPSHNRKVIHIVGAFHSDFDGGTVIELRRRAPGTRILTISLVRADSLTLLEEDRGRADIIIYTGARPEPVEEADVELDDAETAEDKANDAAPAHRPNAMQHQPQHKAMPPSHESP